MKYEDYEIISFVRFQNGIYNLSGEWDGVMGKVITGEYPLSLSEWRWEKINKKLDTNNRVLLCSGTSWNATPSSTLS